MKTLHCDKTSPTYKNTPHTKTHPRCRGPKRLSKADGQRKLGTAKGFRKESRRTTSWGGPTKRLSKRKPTDNASWGGGPSKRLSKRKPTEKLGWTQQSEVHFNVIESTGIPANQKVLYIKEAQRGFLISNHLLCNYFGIYVLSCS